MNASAKEWYDKKGRPKRVAEAETPEGKTRKKAKARYMVERYHADDKIREHRRQYNREYQQRPEAKAKRAANHKKRRAISPPTIEQRIVTNMRSRVRLAVKGVAYKAGRTMELTSCTPEHLCAHLESLFQPGMTWENYGRRGWHIDHVLPCAAFDLTKPEEQRKCFHWSNLQPLWASDNCRKQDWVADYQI